jgi:hypothetical protein
MHRSGTSVVAGMLSMMGVYLDPAFPCSANPTDDVLPDAQSRTNGYAESVAFRLLNESILTSAGANWYDIEPLLARRDQLVFARANVARMQLATYGSLIDGHLALRPSTAGNAWGWKDPRNSLILPYWLRLFPQARLLHVRRQEEGIVNSLMRRAAQQAAEPSTPPGIGARASRLLRNPLLAVNALERRLRLAPPSKTTAGSLIDREFCYRLTDRYVQECLRYRELEDRYLEIWYEDILDDPAGIVTRIADFARLEPGHATRLRAAGMVGREKSQPGGIVPPTELLGSR